MQAHDERTEMMSDDLAMGYVECDGCGHPIEEHSGAGCGHPGDEPCVCGERWTVAEIRDCRKRNGLSARYNRNRLVG